MRRAILVLLVAFATPAFAAANLTGKMTMSLAHNYPGITIEYQILLQNSGDALTSGSINMPVPSQIVAYHGAADSGFAGCGSANCSWSGDVPAGATVTIRFVGSLFGSPGHVVSAQGVINYGETSTVTDDPATPAPLDPTSFTIIRPAFHITKSTPKKRYSVGEFIPYTITVTNVGNQESREVSMATLAPVLDLLPPEVQFVSGTATSGTVVYPNVYPNNAGWFGTIPAGGTVTINLELLALAPGAAVANQARVNDAVTEIAFEDSDDPSTPAAKDPTVVEIAAAAAPALSPIALGLLAGALALIASKLLTTRM